MSKDGKTYLAMCQPHDNFEARCESMKAFFEEVQAARKKHRIREVHVTTITCYLDADGEPVDAFGTFAFGNDVFELPMTAFAYGQATAEQSDFIQEIVKGSRIKWESGKKAAKAQKEAF